MGIMGVLVPVGLIILIGCWLLTWRRLMDRLPALDPSQRDVLVERWSQLFGWSLASLAPLLLLVTVVDDVLRSGWTDEMILPVVVISVIALAGGVWTSKWTHRWTFWFLERE